MFSVSLDFPSQLKFYWYLPPCWALPSITFYSSISTAIIQGPPVVVWMSNVSHGLINLNIWFSAGGTAWGGGAAWLKKVIGGGLWVGFGGHTQPPHTSTLLPLLGVCGWRCDLCLLLPQLAAMPLPSLMGCPLESEAKINLPLCIALGHHSSREETHSPHLLPFSALLGPINFWGLGCHSWFFFLLWLEHIIKYGFTPRCVQPIFPNVLWLRM